jgi:hypothetical protein
MDFCYLLRSYVLEGGMVQDATYKDKSFHL